MPSPPPPPHPRWIFVVVCFLIVLFVVGTMIVVIFSLETPIQHKSQVDVVLFQDADPIRSQRTPFQIKSIHEHMPWVHRIFVVSLLTSIQREDTTLKATFIPFSGTREEAFLHQHVLEQLGETVMFLSDQTIPMRAVKPSYFYSGRYLRLFNVFREQSEMNVLAPYYELPTMPVGCIPRELLQSTNTTWQHVVFRLVTEERVVIFPSLNRDILLSGDDHKNAQQQLKMLTATPPFFATFHINRELRPEYQESANRWINQYLDLIH